MSDSHCYLIVFFNARLFLVGHVTGQYYVRIELSNMSITYGITTETSIASQQLSPLTRLNVINFVAGKTKNDTIVRNCLILDNTY